MFQHFCLLSHFTVTLWTVACQCPLSIGFSQTRILEWVAMPSSRGSSQPRSQTCISCDSSIAGGFFATEPEYTRKHIRIVSWPTRFLLKNLRVLWRFPYMWWVSSFTTLIILSYWFLTVWLQCGLMKTSWVELVWGSLSLMYLGVHLPPKIWEVSNHYFFIFYEKTFNLISRCALLTVETLTLY